jgi:FKBP-type peptidyl-prolyl cis-trans isomerase
VAKKSQRAFALVLAALFFLTSVGTGAAVLWQIKQDNDTNAALEESQSETSEDTAQIETQEGQLQGTKLEGFEPVDNVEELQKIDLEEGDGEAVQAGATVTAHYTGALAKDGTIFQSSKDFGEAIEFPLDGVIKGWTDGVPGMKVGGKRRLVIPYEQAYGEAGRPDGGIPAKADLVFDIEITAVKNL